MPRHYRRGDVSNTTIRAKLYSEGVAFDKLNSKKHLGSEKGFQEHTDEALLFQNNKCLYCTKDFNNSDVRPQRDHIRPMEKENAGLHTWGNILFSCGKCNKEKDRCPGGWKIYLDSKPKAKDSVEKWQSIYKPGYEVSESLVQNCKDLYKQIDELLKTHNII
jgi:hypothetical protein